MLALLKKSGTPVAALAPVKAEMVLLLAVLVSSLVSPIILPYIIRHIPPLRSLSYGCNVHPRMYVLATACLPKPK